MVNQISDNEICLLIKYIKSVLWRVAKRLSYIEEARCLKVNHMHDPNMHSSCTLHAFSCVPYKDKSVTHSDCDTGQLIDESWSDDLVIPIFSRDIGKIVF